MNFFLTYSCSTRSFSTSTFTSFIFANASRAHSLIVQSVDTEAKNGKRAVLEMANAVTELACPVAAASGTRRISLSVISLQKMIELSLEHEASRLVFHVGDTRESTDSVWPWNSWQSRVFMSYSLISEVFEATAMWDSFLPRRQHE